AEELAFAVLDAGHVEAFVASHRAFEAAERIERVDLAPVLARIRERLRASESRERVLACLDLDDLGARRLVVRLPADEIAASEELAARMARDPARTVRASVARRFAREPDARPGLLDALLGDRDGFVARTALRALP